MYLKYVSDKGVSYLERCLDYFLLQGRKINSSASPRNNWLRKKFLLGDADEISWSCENLPLKLRIANLSAHFSKSETPLPNKTVMNDVIDYCCHFVSHKMYDLAHCQ